MRGFLAPKFPSLAVAILIGGAALTQAALEVGGILSIEDDVPLTVQGPFEIGGLGSTSVFIGAVPARMAGREKAG